MVSWLNEVPQAREDMARSISMTCTRVYGHGLYGRRLYGHRLIDFMVIDSMVIDFMVIDSMVIDIMVMDCHSIVLFPENLQGKDAEMIPLP